MANPELLNSTQMAQFVARGFLRFDALVPEALNQKFLSDIGSLHGLEKGAELDDIRQHYKAIMRSSAIPIVKPGTRLADAYPTDSALGELVNLPAVHGVIQSLLGENAALDHHFLHVTFPPACYEAIGQRSTSQPTHQDSTIDPRRAFDVQIMYFPHEVTREMGGTRFLPGSHLRIVSEASIGRYQNLRGQEHVICPAGTVFFLHHGIWHGGGHNTSDELRYMFKIRLCPTVRQSRKWDLSDLPNDHFEQRPIFWTDGEPDEQHIHSILTTGEPWFEYDTGRLEYLNRIRLWRYMLGDESFDADYWLTRIENEH